MTTPAYAPTLLLTRSEVASLLEPHALLSALRGAFAAHSTRRTVPALRVPVALPPGEVPAGASAMLLAPGLVPGTPAYSVKVHAKFPGGDPAIRGVLVLHDLATGVPLAVMESSHLTALRTGLASALGAGAQGRAALAALRLVWPIRAVRVLDALPGAAARFAADPACEGLDVAIASSVEDALDGADVAVTATWAREPFLFRRHLHPGLHVTTLGPDQPGKYELAADALEAAVVVVDDRGLAVEMGAVGGAGLGPDVIHAELGEVLAGTRPGRESTGQVTVFGSVGLAFQDLAAGWLAYTLTRERGVGRSMDFLS